MTRPGARFQPSHIRTTLFHLRHARPSSVDQWFAQAGAPPAADLARSGAPAKTIRDLMELASPFDREHFQDLSLDYGATEGTDRLRQAIVASGYARDPHDVTVTNGAIEALLLAFAASVDSRNTIAIGVPAYDTMMSVAMAVGAEVHPIDVWSSDADRLCLDGFTDAVIARSSAVVVNSPHNPTGLRPERCELVALAERCRSLGTIFIIDEVALGTLDPEASSFIDQDEFEEGGSIVIGDVSKALGLGGLRIGWSTTRSQKLIRRFGAAHDLTTLGNSAASQYLAVIALEHRRQLVPSALAVSNLKTLTAWLDGRGSLSPVPVDGFVAFPLLDLSVPSLEFANSALRVGVSVMPGSLFGVEGRLRLGLGVDDVIFARALDTLGELMDCL